MRALPYNGFLNRRSRVRITPGTPDFSNEINGVALVPYAHETRTARRATVQTFTKDGTVDSRLVPIDLLTPGSQRPDWKNGRAWR